MQPDAIIAVGQLVSVEQREEGCLEVAWGNVLVGTLTGPTVNELTDAVAFTDQLYGPLTAVVSAADETRKSFDITLCT